MRSLSSATCVAALVFCVTPTVDAQDSDFPTDIYGHGVVASASQSLSHDVQDMIDTVRDVYGDSVADQMEADLLGGGASISVVELYVPTDAAGVHDRDTIGLNTTGLDGEEAMSEVESAMVLQHEWEHATRVRDSGNPTDVVDPLTFGPCGSYEHARMHFAQINQVLEALCEGALPGSDVCFMAINGHSAGQFAMDLGDAHGEENDCAAERQAAAADKALAEDFLLNCCAP